MIALILALIASALVLDKFNTGPLGWIAIVLLLLGLVYKEDWIFDPHEKTIVGQLGFYPLLKKTSLSFEEIAYIQLAAFAKGTVPGSNDEKASNNDAFNEMHADMANRSSKISFDWFRRKKLYITLLVVTKREERYLLDMVPARRAMRLSQAGKALSALIGCSFFENLPE